MAMVVKNNMSAVSTLNTLNKNSNALQKSLSKVSSGMKINSAQDDASGYAISERMRVQIRSLDQANQNTQNGSSMMKTAEGAVSSTVEILKSLKEKAINAANDTNKDSDRTTIQKEIDQFIDQIDDNALTTFNGKYLVDGSKSQQTKEAIATHMTNQSLQKGTEGTTALTALSNRNNESLEINKTDYVTASYVMNGHTYTTKYQVEDTTLNDVFKNLNAVKGPKTSQSAEPAAVQDDSTKSAAELYSDVQTAATTIKDKVEASTDYTGANAVDKAVVDAWTASLSAKDAYGEVAAFKSFADYDADRVAAGGTALNDPTLAAKIDAAYDTTDSDALTTAVTAYNASDGVNSKLKAAMTTVNGATPDELAGVAALTANSTMTDRQKELVSALKVDGVAAALSSKAGDAANELQADIEDKLTNDATLSAARAVSVATEEGATATATNLYALGSGASLGNGDTDATSAAATAVGVVTAITDATALPDTIYFGAGTSSTAADAAAKGHDGTDPVAHSATLSITNYKTAKLADAAATTAAGLTVPADDPQTGDEEGVAGNGFNMTYGGTDAVKKSTNIGKSAFGDDVDTADGTEGLTIAAANGGMGGQISGLTISITDSEGNVKKSANASLDNFQTTIFAKNKSDANELTFQVGAAANQAITVGLEDMRSEALGLKGRDGITKVSVATQDKANAAVATFDNAIQKALDQQTTIGAIEARLEYTSQNLTTSSENVQAAESTIRDADMAKEMTNYTKNNVLLQAAQSMLAQANQSSSAVLSLLQ